MNTPTFLNLLLFWLGGELFLLGYTLMEWTAGGSIWRTSISYLAGAACWSWMFFRVVL